MTPVQKGYLIAGTFTILLLLVLGPLISNLGWMFAGHVVFGLTVGLMVGMTKSAVVSAVLPLFFTFAGTSIVALSVGESRTPEQLDMLGRQLTGFSFGSFIGLLLGIGLRMLNVELPLGKFRE